MKAYAPLSIDTDALLAVPVAPERLSAWLPSEVLDLPSDAPHELGSISVSPAIERSAALRLLLLRGRFAWCWLQDWIMILPFAPLGKQ